MLLRQQILSVIVTVLWSAVASALNVPGLSVNPRLKLSPVASAPHVQTERGFFETLSRDGLEIQIKGTHFTDPQAGRQMAAVEYSNIVKLYSPRGNPYEGQITDVIQCARAYLPESFTFEFGGERAYAVIAGATERKLFGACTREQVGYWAGYVSFYYPNAQMVIEARVFEKAPHPSPGALKKRTAEVGNLARTLFVPEGHKPK